MDGPGDYSFGSQPLSFGTQAEAELDHTDYELLKFALQNEKASPELLPYEVELVQRVYLQLEHQVSIQSMMDYLVSVRTSVGVTPAFHCTIFIS